LIQYILVDSMDAKQARGELPDSLVPVRERMRLGAQPDSVLQVYMREHEPALRVLAERFAARREFIMASVDGESAPAGAGTPEQRAEVAGLVPAMRSLLVGALQRHEERPGCVFLKVGGSGSDHVGFIYAPPGCVLPPITPAFIYVEAVTPGWYVYRTA
jgi:hypothetical protein